MARTRLRQGGETKRTAAAVKRALAAHANPRRAKELQRFYRTEKGGYGEGDRFISVMVPVQRRIARAHRDLPLAETLKLLKSPIHEHRLTALFILVERYRRGDEAEKARVAKAYLENLAHVNNWDLVDASAPHILGAHLLTRPRAVLDRLARSKRLWDRRVAIVATQALIREGEFDDTLRLAERLLHDGHDLMHKAVGWMLREVGNRDAAALRRFLDRRQHRMPRTMLRYAIEKLPPLERRRRLEVSRSRPSD